MKQAVLLGILDQTLKFSAIEVIDSICNYTCSSIDENLNNFHCADEIIRSPERIFEIDLSKKYRTSGEIKKIIANAKK